MGMGTGPGEVIREANQTLRLFCKILTTTFRPIANQKKLKSVHSRNMSFLVHECRQKVMRIYNLRHENEEVIKHRVNWLLEKDRFVCREDHREVRLHCLSFEADTDDI